MTTLNDKGLREAEESRRLAMLANDGAQLGALLADELLYVHSTGGKDSKQSYVHRLASGALRYERVEFIEPAFRVIGTTGFVTAAMQAVVVSGGNHREVANNYLAVWEHGANGWKMLYLQGTPMPAA
jgi:hypothetical protein